MTTIITLTNSNQWLYLVIFLLGMIILYKMDKPFNKNNLVESFLDLSNKFVILLITLSFMFSFIYELIGQTDKIITFLSQNIKLILYYLLLNYSLFYGLKLIDWIKNFYKDNDLLNIKYFSKLERENNKK